LSRAPSRRPFLLALALLVLAGGAAVARSAGHLGGLRTARPVVVTSLPIVTVLDTLRPRETVSQLFERNGVRGVDFSAVGQAVRSFDPARLRAGMVFAFRQRDGEPEPHAVVVRVAHDTRLVLHRPVVDGTWSATAERIAWHAEPFVVQGTVRSSVSDAITGALDDELLPFESRAQLVWSLADVYDWVVDFSRDVQEGDRFRVLAERQVSSEGEVRFGRVLAARLEVGPTPLYAYRFDDPNGRDAFYDERGRSMRRELLRAPLEYRRISSSFSRSRFHPILRVRRAHQGIDFSAAYGTPIRSVGDGVVVSAGREGGYGNLVEIRHNGRTTSRYAHLSDFARGIHAGARVTQGQTIGFVGASGLATSPHLHYELRVNGAAVNPRRQFAAGEGAPIAAARRDAYEAERQRLHALLEPAAVAAVPVRSTDD
jgi:murein DD-endopeptidase MepM/ murein hydrolase activator NlpD